jgi:hypothetical protein
MLHDGFIEDSLTLSSSQNVYVNVT